MFIRLDVFSFCRLASFAACPQCATASFVVTTNRLNVPRYRSVNKALEYNRVARCPALAGHVSLFTVVSGQIIMCPVFGFFKGYLSVYNRYGIC